MIILCATRLEARKYTGHDCVVYYMFKRNWQKYFINKKPKAKFWKHLTKLDKEIPENSFVLMTDKLSCYIVSGVWKTRRIMFSNETRCENVICGMMASNNVAYDVAYLQHLENLYLGITP